MAKACVASLVFLLIGLHSAWAATYVPYPGKENGDMRVLNEGVEATPIPQSTYPLGGGGPLAA